MVKIANRVLLTVVFELEKSVKLTRMAKTTYMVLIFVKNPLVCCKE